jgi:hypothetical protein
MTSITSIALRFMAPLSVAASLALTAMPAQAQATRTWVSGVGDDVNPCSRTAPCKTFAGAISKTSAGGEINCLDPAGYGAVTITKSITIDCGETHGSILASGTNGVNVNDSASGFPNTIRVVLRGLSINGAATAAQNASGNPGTGLVGVSFTSGASLYMEDVYIQNFNAGTAAGVRFAPGGAAKMGMDNVTIVNCGTGATGGGIRIQPTGAAGNARVTLSNVRLEGNAGDALRLDSTGNTLASRNEVVIHDSVIGGGSGGIIAVTAAGTAQSFVNVSNTLIFNNTGVALSVSGTANSLIRASGNTIVLNGFATSISGGGQIQSYGDNETQGNSNPAAFSAPTLVTN